MRLFDIFKNKENINTKEKKFFMWMDDILKNNLPNAVVAINFNLYEDQDNTWSIEFVGTGSFDLEDEDWACDEIFVNRENQFKISYNGDWKEVEKLFIDYLNEYLNKGTYADKLKNYSAVGIGFVDGDISVIYKKES